MTNPKEEKTVFIIKPDGVKRGLVGEIISRIEKRGLKIIALDMLWASKEEMNNHYPKDEAWIKRLGEKTMSNYRHYSVDSAISANLNKRSVRNIVHASENLEEAENELGLWFKREEIHDYKRAEEDIMF